MVAMGYGGSNQEAGQTTRYSSDGGIDGIIKEDRLGLDSIYLQAKRYSDKTVGRPEIQSFAGALDLHRARKGVFITTFSFSREAQGVCGADREAHRAHRWPRTGAAHDRAQCRRLDQRAIRRKGDRLRLFFGRIE